jgi:hypothetical protein
MNVNVQPDTLAADLLAASATFVALSSGGGYGDSIRKRQRIGTGNYREPTEIYLIYIGLDNNKQLVVRHMRRTPITPADIAAVEAELVTAAKLPNEPRPGQIARDFTRIDFTAPSYFTIVVDGSGWEFYYPFPNEEDPIPGEIHDPLVFIEKKRIFMTSRAENHSFYNAVPVAPAGCNGFRCINFFTDAGGNILEQIEDYCFQIYLRVPFSETQAAGHKITVIIDPDGQNQGPP